MPHRGRERPGLSPLLARGGGSYRHGMDFDVSEETRLMLEMARSFIDASAAAWGDAFGAAKSSAPSVPITGRSQRGSKRRE